MIVHFRPGARGKLRFEAREERGDSGEDGARGSRRGRRRQRRSGRRRKGEKRVVGLFIRSFMASFTN